MKISNKFLIALTGMLGFAGCKKATDLQPIDLIPVEAAFNTMSDLDQAVAGVYGTIQYRRSVYISATISDEIRLGTGAEYRNVGNALFNWQHVSDSQDWRDTETGGVWTNMYAVIDRSNRALEQMANIPLASSADSSLMRRHRGELLGLRAFAHLELLRVYSETPGYDASRMGVVVQTTYVKQSEIKSYRPSRNTQGEVAAQIIKDLDSAKIYLPTTFTNIGRFTRNAAFATHTRLATLMREWQTVITQATQVLAVQPVSDTARFRQIWSTRALANNQSTEVIFKTNISAANVGNAVGTLWQDVGAGAAVQATPAQKLLNTYNTASDVRWTSYFGMLGTRRLISKYGLNTGSNSELFEYDVKVLRSAEALLSRAEAYAELNQLTQANSDLALLRQNRIIGYVHVPIADRQTLINEIVQERYKELAFEGDRYFTLRRRNLPIVRDASDVAGNPLAQTLSPSDSKYLIPIPQQEIAANPNLKQNPGY